MEYKVNSLLTLKEQQKIMLDMMKSIHTFCTKNKIRYVLLYGTLLGAVRHKGFIPWDNDMDIGIPRPDYDKLLNLLNTGEKMGEHYYHLHYTNDNNYHYQIIRICDDRTLVRPVYIRDQPNKMGVWVDIFPIDGIPQNNPSGLFHKIRLTINLKIQIADIYSIREKKDIANRLGNLCCRIFPNVKKRNFRIDSICRKTSFDVAKYVADMSDRDGNVIPMDKDDFNSAVLLEFEDATFYCPAKWDEYLKKAYGDYMKLPPENKRFTHETGCRWV